MKRRIKTIAALALAGGLALPFSAQAHYAWLLKLHGAHTVVYGHSPSNSDAYKPSKVGVARGISNGKMQNLKITRHKDYATVDADADKTGIVGIVLDNGFWAQKANGEWVNKPKTEVPGAVKGSRTFKYSTAYLNSREPAKPFGFDFEMIPITNPAKLKQGDMLTVQVLYKGKPLPGASVTPDVFGGGHKVKTDGQGKATLRIPNKVFNAFEASYRVPMQDTTKIDSIGLSSTLTFDARHKGGAH